MASRNRSRPLQGSINGNQLAQEIATSLGVYAAFTRDEVLEIAKEVTAEAAEKLKTAGNFKNRTGDYRKGWENTFNGRAWVTRNKTDYQLTHLLEKGHAKRNGGRTRKFVHIKPVEQETIADFEKKLRERL